MDDFEFNNSNNDNNIDSHENEPMNITVKFCD